MNTKLLKQLVQSNGVAGNEENIEEFLVNFAKKHEIKYQYDKGYGVIMGNEKSDIFCFAHLDEVGGKITSIKGNILKFKGVGWVNPGMFVGREVEIISSSGDIISGLVIGTKPFTVDVKKFSDLKIIVDKEEAKKINSGDYLRYKSNFDEKEESIFATSLDNRIGVFTLLEFILNNKKYLKKVAFCFTTEEEITNKGGLYYVKKYKPKMMLVYDMMLEFLLKNKYSQDTFVLLKTKDYLLNKSVQNDLEKFEKVSFMTTTDAIMVEGEAFLFEKHGVGTAINIFCPMYNYHHGTYFVEKKSIKNYLSFTDKIIKHYCDKMQ